MYLVQCKLSNKIKSQIPLVHMNRNLMHAHVLYNMSFRHVLSMTNKMCIYFLDFIPSMLIMQPIIYGKFM